MGVVMNYNVIKWVWIRYSMPRPVLDTRNRSTGIEYSSTLVSNRPSLVFVSIDYLNEYFWLLLKKQMNSQPLYRLVDSLHMARLTCIHTGICAYAKQFSLVINAMKLYRLYPYFSIVSGDTNCYWYDTDIMNISTVKQRNTWLYVKISGNSQIIVISSVDVHSAVTTNVVDKTKLNLNTQLRYHVIQNRHHMIQNFDTNTDLLLPQNIESIDWV